jgi:hypothetical protein
MATERSQVGNYVHLTHADTRIAVCGANGILGENHCLGNVTSLAASSVNGVDSMQENAGPTITADLVRESGFLFASSLILGCAHIAHHSRPIGI